MRRSGITLLPILLRLVSEVKCFTAFTAECQSSLEMSFLLVEENCKLPDSLPGSAASSVYTFSRDGSQPAALSCAVLVYGLLLAAWPAAVAVPQSRSISPACFDTRSAARPLTSLGGVHFWARRKFSLESKSKSGNGYGLGR